MSAARHAEPRRWKRRVKLGIKLTVTVGLCTFLLWNADWSSLWESLRTANLLLGAGVILLMLAAFPLSAYKWQLLLRIHDAKVRFSRLHRYYFTAAFFNNFFPSSIGGDGYRIYRTLDDGRNRATAVVAIFLERLSGLVALLVLGLMAAGLIYLQRDDPVARGYLLLGGSGMAAAVVGAILAWRFGWLNRLRTSSRIPAIVTTAIAQFGDLRRKPRQSVWALGGVSVIFHLHTTIYYALLLAALGAPLPFLEVILIITLTTLTGLLPITINGIGLLDGAFVYLAAHYGVGYETALSAMLIVRGVTLFCSVIGASLYFMEGSAPDRTSLRAGAAQAVEEAATAAPAGETTR